VSSPGVPGRATIVTGAVIGSQLPASSRTQSVGRRQQPHIRIRTRPHEVEAVPDAGDTRPDRAAEAPHKAHRTRPRTSA
jgi:hypothetical protein